MRILKSARTAAVGLAGVVLASTLATAGTINLRWDPLAGATGYRVHYGQSPGSYTQVLDVGAATQATVTGLSDCSNYFLAVKGYSAVGESTSFSNEIVGWARPEIGSIGPTTVRQGDQVTLTVTGANFQSGADVSIDTTALPRDAAGDDLLRVDNVSVSCSQITANLTVEPTARGQRAMEMGSFGIPIQVVNPDSVFGAGTKTLTVQFGESRADINRSDAVTTDRVDGKDLTWLAFAFNTSEGQPTHNPDADLNGDGIVDGDDLALLISTTRFGLCWDGSSWDMDACP